MNNENILVMIATNDVFDGYDVLPTCDVIFKLYEEQLKNHNTTGMTPVLAMRFDSSAYGEMIALYTLGKPVVYIVCKSLEIEMILLSGDTSHVIESLIENVYGLIGATEINVTGTISLVFKNTNGFSELAIDIAENVGMNYRYIIVTAEINELQYGATTEIGETPHGAVVENDDAESDWPVDYKPNNDQSTGIILGGKKPLYDGAQFTKTLDASVEKTYAAVSTTGCLSCKCDDNESIGISAPEELSHLDESATRYISNQTEAAFIEYIDNHAVMTYLALTKKSVSVNKITRVVNSINAYVSLSGLDNVNGTSLAYALLRLADKKYFEKVTELMNMPVSADVMKVALELIKDVKLTKKLSKAKILDSVISSARNAESQRVCKVSDKKKKGK